MCLFATMTPRELLVIRSSCESDTPKKRTPPPPSVTHLIFFSAFNEITQMLSDTDRAADAEVDRAADKLAKAWKRVRGRTDANMTGMYLDARHGGCLVAICPATGPTYIVRGVYGANEARPTGLSWSGSLDVEARQGEVIPFTLHLTGKEVEEGGKRLHGLFQIASKTLQFSPHDTWVPLYFNSSQFVVDCPQNRTKDTLCGNVMNRRIHDRRVVTRKSMI